ncbi:MAG: hypothetical protein ACE5E8_06735 [Acidimicrobiia bacterium]
MYYSNGDVFCSASLGTATVDSSGSVGAYSSMVLDAAGSPVISCYLSSPNLDLALVHCGNPDCTAANTSTIVESADHPSGAPPRRRGSCRGTECRD